MIRTADNMVYRGAVAVLPGYVCWLLNNAAGLDKLRTQVRGQNPDLDQGLMAIRLAGLAYESSCTGTKPAPQPEPMSKSHQPTTETYGTSTAATILGISDRAVRKAIAEKRLHATRLDGRYRMTQQDLATYLKAG